jgi:hypothetical protein
MISINLQQIPTICFSGKNEKRKNQIRSVVSECKLNAEFVECTISESQAEGNRKTFIRILERCMQYKGPCLVLEDDAHPTSWYKNDFIIPDDSDAFYLGSCVNFLCKDWEEKSILHDVLWNYDIQVEDISDYLYKVKNMLTAHAIVFVSDKYKEICYNSLKYNINNNMHSDVIFAHLMNQYNVYLNKKPAFFQNCHDENIVTYWLTKIPLERIINQEIRISTDNKVVIFS